MHFAELAQTAQNPCCGLGRPTWLSSVVLGFAEADDDLGTWADLILFFPPLFILALCQDTVRVYKTTVVEKGRGQGGWGKKEDPG